MMTSLNTRENEEESKNKRWWQKKVPKNGYKSKIIYINGNNKTNEWKLWMTETIVLLIVFYVAKSSLFSWTIKHKNIISPYPATRSSLTTEGRPDTANTSPGARDHGVTQGQEENTARPWKTAVIPRLLRWISQHSSNLPLCTFPKPQD